MCLDLALSDSKCTLIVDTGSDISVIKSHKVKPTRIFYPNEKYPISGIGHDKTLTQTYYILLEGKFHIVDYHFPIPTDGILDRDFLTKYRCKIAFDPWLLTLTINQQEIAIPVDDNFKQSL